MKNLLKFQILMVVILFGFTQLFAQPGRGLNRGNITRLYDTKTVETVTGKITKIEKAQTGYGRFSGTLLTIKDKKQELKIYFAPDWYLVQEKLEFKKGESLTVTGSRINFQNEPLLITKDATYNKKKLVIRNENGVPVWAGKRMGPGQGRRVRR
ncbi:hypothetical protein H8E88_16110 [candidate division KSB1 bacterium]|nr:hypothetical protein [candidate division KSB1 bacterium]MBL7094375.1 hypothetical protein [candidate division KSB1 bacterium]